MKLKNSLIVLDVESTGVWIEKDKIIEIALIKYLPDGKKETYYKRVNPGIAIPRIITDLTGIADKDVKDAPAFKTIAWDILSFMGESDFGGFNVERFDLPLLEREFFDAGHKFEWKQRKIYDAQKVFHLNEKRDLSAAYKFYCNKDLIGAHSAMADSEAVYEILEQQIKKYGEGREDIACLDKFEYSANMDFFDSERKFCWWNGRLYPTFGKYARKVPLEDLVKVDSGWLNWVLRSDFSDTVKNVVRAVLNGEVPVKKNTQPECPPDSVPNAR